MATLSISPPFPIFNDLDGKPLEDGSIFIGEKNLNPETNPITVYWDAALSQPTAQPIKTLGGYPSRNGTPARLFIDGDNYSITVKNKKGEIVYTAMSSTQRAPLGPSVLDYGADPTGTVDSTAALQNAFNYGGDLLIPSGTYLYSYLEFNVPINLTGDGVLRYDGSIPPTGTASIQINDTFTADKFRVSSSGAAELAFDYIAASTDDVRINLLELKADVQRNQTGGSNFFGNNIFINEVVAENVARPIAFQPPSGTTDFRENIHLGSLVAKNYIRGLAISYANNWSVGSVHVETRWTGADVTPGYNGVLLQACNDWTIGECYIADAPEHSFRIGGSADTTNFSIGQITSVNSAGCAMKFNVDAGYLAKNGQVGQLIGINTGEGSVFGNTEVTRLTRVKDVTIGSITGLVSVTTALLMQDVDGLTVGEIYAENVRARATNFRVDADASSGNVRDVNIGTVVAYMHNTARAAFGFDYQSGSRSLGNITIENAFATGFSNFLIDAGATNVYSGPIFVRARSLSTDPGGGVANVANTDLFQVDWTRGIGRYQGKAFGLSQTAQNTVQAGQFVNDITVDQNGKGAMFFRSNVAAPAKDVYGAGVAFSRLASDRRGAAIVAKQTGDNEQNMGLAFLAASGSIATDLLVERMVLKHNDTLWLRLKDFADNAAALAGGLVAGDLYKSSGTVKIVV